jgi:hypothetical protein
LAPTTSPAISALTISAITGREHLGERTDNRGRHLRGTVDPIPAHDLLEGAPVRVLQEEIRVKTPIQVAFILVAVLSFAGLAYSPAHAQSTAFTYQGSLDDAGAPASGLHDFRFRLFDAASGGSQLGSTLCVDNVTVVEGVFTAQPDFGQQFATTAQRYLEIEVRRDTGLTCGSAAGFVVMTPRQQITATPVATHANSAFALDAADGSPTSAVFVDNSGNVGIGTTTPATKLHVKGAEEGLHIDGAAVGASNVAYTGFYDLNGTRTGYVGDGSSSDNSVYLNSDAGDVHLYTAVGAALTAKSDGKVGIGTTTPRSSLHVIGSEWLTSGNGAGLPTAAGAGLRLYHDSTRGMIFAFDYATASPRDLSLQEPGGNVGIGTTTPAARLDVRGNIKLGSSGQYSALGGQEDLRLIRGDIEGTGAILRGDGFTVNRVQEGRYEITFTPPFSGIPTITASTETQVSNIRWVFVDLWNLSGSTANLSVLNLNGAPTNSKFSICVIGPR